MQKITDWNGMTHSHGFAVNVFQDADSDEYIAKIETYIPPLVPVHIPGKKTPMMEFDEQEEIRATSIDELRDATKQNIEARCGNITQFIEN